MAHPVVEGFLKEWPAAFAGPKLDELSGNAIRWSTTQNRRSRGEIPAECFVDGRPTLVIRDPFLRWWASTLSNARRWPAVSSHPQPRRSRRQVKAEALVAAIGEPVGNDFLDEVPDKGPAAPHRRRSTVTTPRRSRPPDVAAR
jgi:hypothetical protein